MTDPYESYASDVSYNSDASSLGLNSLALSIIATVFSWPGALVMLFLERQNTYVRAVSLQCAIIELSLFLALLFFAITAAFQVVFLVGFIIFAVVYFLVYILIIVLAVLRARSGVFIGIPPLGAFVLQIANK